MHLRMLVASNRGSPATALGCALPRMPRPRPHAPHTPSGLPQGRCSSAPAACSALRRIMWWRWGISTSCRDYCAQLPRDAGTFSSYDGRSISNWHACSNSLPTRQQSRTCIPGVWRELEALVISRQRVSHGPDVPLQHAQVVIRLPMRVSGLSVVPSSCWSVVKQQVWQASTPPDAPRRSQGPQGWQLAASAAPPGPSPELCRSPPGCSDPAHAVHSYDRVALVHPNASQARSEVCGRADEQRPLHTCGKLGRICNAAK